MGKTSLFPRRPGRGGHRSAARRARPSAGYTDPFFADPAEVEDDYRRMRRD
jgi:hypothetical protein